MSDNELKDLAGDIAKVAKNKITSSTKFFGYSAMTVEDIEKKIPELVQGVLRIRAGQDDTMIPMLTLSE